MAYRLYLLSESIYVLVVIERSFESAIFRIIL